MRKYLLLFICFLFGCTSNVARQNEALRSGVHAVNKSIEKKRFDLAEKYSRELTRLVPPPKKEIKVEEFSIGTGVDTKHYTVLPESKIKTEIIVENSAEYNRVVQENEKLAAILKHESESLNKYKKTNDEVLRKANDELHSEKRKSFWGWIAGLVPIMGFGGILAVCIFFPPALPVVVNWFSSVVSAIGKLFVK